MSQKLAVRFHGRTHTIATSPPTRNNYTSSRYNLDSTRTYTWFASIQARSSSSYSSRSFFHLLDVAITLISIHPDTVRIAVRIQCAKRHFRITCLKETLTGDSHCGAASSNSAPLCLTGCLLRRSGSLALSQLV